MLFKILDNNNNICLSVCSPAGYKESAILESCSECHLTHQLSLIVLKRKVVLYSSKENYTINENIAYIFVVVM